MLDVWREDGYRDYLHKDSAPPQHAKSLIKRMSQTGARSPGATQMLATIDSLGEVRVTYKRTGLRKGEAVR